MQDQSTTLDEPQPSFQLLQLPGRALVLVLQQLDQCTLARTAVTCSTLRQAAVEAISKVALQVHGNNQAKLDSFTGWAELHSTNLNNLEQCIVVAQSDWTLCLSSLQCRRLRQLHLEGLSVQLGPAGGFPGVLQDCTGLTALSLEACEVQSVAAAAAAIAALPQLQSLKLGYVQCGQGCLERAVNGAEATMAQGSTALLQLELELDELDEFELGLELDELELELGHGRRQGSWLFAELSSAAVLRQLTHLSLDCVMGPGLYWDDQAASLCQLSGLVNLRHLELHRLPGDPAGVPGGLPSQLVKLTCLDVSYLGHCVTTEQFQHLSDLTALQQLAVCIGSPAPGGLSGLSGVQRLSQLTSLKLDSPAFDFSLTSTQHWNRLTALQSLALLESKVEPEALLQFKQLQALDVQNIKPLGHASFEGLLDAVSHFTQLTSLVVSANRSYPVPSPAAFTALTASTNLCSLKLYNTQEWILFSQNTCYPSLSLIDSAFKASGCGWPLSEQQLQQLCACCPAVKSLRLAAVPDLSPTAWQPLMQLPALTHLVVTGVYEGTVTAVTDAAAQLTGLKQLELRNLLRLRHPALQKLTVLTALEQLTLHMEGGTLCGKVLQNKAPFGSPPDVWMQLQRHLSRLQAQS